MSCGIYKIINQVNGKIYIGQSIAIERRFTKHRNEGFNYNSKVYDYPLYRAIRKYHLQNFVFEIIEECSVQSLNSREQFYISKFDSMNKEKGYNICFGKTYPAKLIPENVIEIQKVLVEGNLSQAEIGERFDVTQQMISAINIGQSWRSDKLDYPLKKKKLRYCSCGKELTKYSTTGKCQECARKETRVVERPNREELKKLIRNNSFVSIGKQFGVSDNSVRKWCKSVFLPSRIKDIKNYTDNEWKDL